MKLLVRDLDSLFLKLDDSQKIKLWNNITESESCEIKVMSKFIRAEKIFHFGNYNRIFTATTILFVLLVLFVTKNLLVVIPTAIILLLILWGINIRYSGLLYTRSCQEFLGASSMGHSNDK